jgi:hypothetical protein
VCAVFFNVRLLVFLVFFNVRLLFFSGVLKCTTFGYPFWYLRTFLTLHLLIWNNTICLCFGE